MQVLNSLESQAKRFWGRVPNDASTRDAQMAVNLDWLLSGPFANKKIIVWGHNGHLSRGVKEGDDSFTSMAARLAEKYGDEMFGIGVSGATGSYENYASGATLPVPAATAGSLEEAWARSGVEVGIISLRDVQTSAPWLSRPLSARLSDYAEITRVWPRYFDAMLLVRTVTPTTRAQAR
jgi:erythromycin esterase